MSIDHQTAPEFWAGRPEELARKQAQVLNGVLRGQTNNVFVVTLRGTPEVTTVVTAEFSRSTQVAALVPKSSAAAVDFALGTTYAVAGNGSITINHEPGASDREYGVVLQG